jgi:hypothetical protein
MSHTQRELGVTLTAAPTPTTFASFAIARVT